MNNLTYSAAALPHLQLVGQIRFMWGQSIFRASSADLSARDNAMLVISTPPLSLIRMSAGPTSTVSVVSLFADMFFLSFRWDFFFNDELGPRLIGLNLKRGIKASVGTLAVS